MYKINIKNYYLEKTLNYKQHMIMINDLASERIKKAHSLHSLIHNVETRTSRHNECGSLKETRALGSKQFK